MRHRIDRGHDKNLIACILKLYTIGYTNVQAILRVPIGRAHRETARPN